MEANWGFQKPVYIYCPKCGNKAWIGEDHSEHNEQSRVDRIFIDGVHILHDIIDQNEEKQLISIIESRKPWVESQEGRRKQDWGPKVSVLKRKAVIGDFRGFPDYATNLFGRIMDSSEKVMDRFHPVEFCVLEYTPERKSYIRPHYDDTWIWGDRLVTVNLLSETALRLTKEFRIPPYEIVIKMPARSLLVLYGEARYDWHHSISRYDIKSRRVAMTWREFSQEVMVDPEYKDFVDEVIRKSLLVDNSFYSSSHILSDCEMKLVN